MRGSQTSCALSVPTAWYESDLPVADGEDCGWIGLSLHGRQLRARELGSFNLVGKDDKHLPGVWSGASNSTTIPTVTRIPRAQALPPITAGSMVIRSNVFISRFDSVCGTELNVTWV